MTSLSSQGQYQARFKPLADAFIQLMQQEQQLGAALAVFWRGHKVVDIWAGYKDRRRQQAWQQDTLVNIFSCGKPVVAVAALQLVEQGKLKLDQPLAEVWPLMAVNGKEAITLRQLLCHRAGLPAIVADLPNESLFDWGYMLAAIEQESPWWLPSSEQAYSPMLYGWILGGLIKHLTGISVGQYLNQQISTPHQLELYCGLKDEQLEQVSELVRIKNNNLDEQAKKLIQQTMTVGSLANRAFANPAALFSSSNSKEWRKLEQPAATYHASARGLAGFYAQLIAGNLLSKELLQQMLQPQSNAIDLSLLTEISFGLGCVLEQGGEYSFCLTPTSFGHPGAGGCLGCASLEHELSMAFVTNSLDVQVLTDPRAQQLNKVLLGCIS